MSNERQRRLSAVVRGRRAKPMTVAELIDRLRDLPPDALVSLVTTGADGSLEEHRGVSDVGAGPDGIVCIESDPFEVGRGTIEDVLSDLRKPA